VVACPLRQGSTPPPSSSLIFHHHHAYVRLYCPPTSVALNSLMSVNMWLWHVMEAEEAAQELEQRRAAGIITDEEEQLQVGAVPGPDWSFLRLLGPACMALPAPVRACVGLTACACLPAWPGCFGPACACLRLPAAQGGASKVVRGCAHPCKGLCGCVQASPALPDWRRTCDCNCDCNVTLTVTVIVTMPCCRPPRSPPSQT
jgi:hypothetical protein